jgi:predicted nucleotidyltransferase
MKRFTALQIHRGAIRQIVEAHRTRNPRVFGSVAEGSDTEESDLDILVDPTSETTLFDIGAIRHELLQLLGVPVDVLTPKALPEKFRAAVLAEAVAVRARTSSASLTIWRTCCRRSSASLVILNCWMIFAGIASCAA